MEENNQQNNEFIREQIKDKPVNKKKAMNKVGFSALCGVVFAVVAAVIFAAVEPAFQKLFHPEGKATVNSETVGEAVADTEIETESASTETALPTQMPLSLSEYQSLQNQLYAVGNQVNQSIVTVTSVVNSTDWFNNSYEKEGLGSGVIIQDTGSKLLILTERKAIADATKMSVTFVDNTVAPAELIKYDGNTGLAVLGVAKTNVKSQTLNSLAIAEFGNSRNISKGTIAIAVGSPLGTNYSILTGSITSVDNEISTLDHNYSIFTTDIVANKNGSGILVNVNGQVIGVVMQGYSNASDENTLTAVSASELKNVIDMLSASQNIPYLGLTVATVTDRIADEYDIPSGVYIKEAAMDSPAMAAGLQSGDVITRVNTNKVATAEAYSMQIMKLTPGSTIPVEVERQGADGYSKITCQVTVGVLQ